MTGAGIGVGLDQMLDLLVNSNLSQIFLLDITQYMGLTSKALLEVGSKFFDEYQRYPTTAEFVEFFREDKVAETMAFLGDSFSQTEKDEIVRSLEKRCKKSIEENLLRASGSRAVYSYLSYKKEQSEFNTWLSNDANLQRVIGMYRSSRIHIVRGDIAGTHSMSSIAEFLQESGTPVSVVYLSNAMQYLGWSRDDFMSGSHEQLISNLQRLAFAGPVAVVKSYGIRSETRPDLPNSIGNMMRDWSYGNTSFSRDSTCIEW